MQSLLDVACRRFGANGYWHECWTNTFVVQVNIAGEGEWDVEGVSAVFTSETCIETDVGLPSLRTAAKIDVNFSRGNEWHVEYLLEAQEREVAIFQVILDHSVEDLSLDQNIHPQY
ncbi:hypothetical protein LA080_002012 [Diaporthe eres]|nr:hypothetical protein LA080_002012 [Diaporthe eres]